MDWLGLNPDDIAPPTVYPRPEIFEWGGKIQWDGEWGLGGKQGGVKNTWMTTRGGDAVRLLRDLHIGFNGPTKDGAYLTSGIIQGRRATKNVQGSYIDVIDGDGVDKDAFLAALERVLEGFAWFFWTTYSNGHMVPDGGKCLPGKSHLKACILYDWKRTPLEAKLIYQALKSQLGEAMGLDDCGATAAQPQFTFRHNPKGAPFAIKGYGTLPQSRANLAGGTDIAILVAQEEHRQAGIQKIREAQAAARKAWSFDSDGDDEPAKIAAALKHIDGSSRDTWLHVGMAIKHGLGDGGFGIWDSWASGYEGYDGATQRTHWDSFGPGSITLGTLFGKAKEGGWDRGAWHREKGSKARRSIKAESTLDISSHPGITWAFEGTTKNPTQPQNGPPVSREGTGGTYTKRKAPPVPSSKAPPVPSAIPLVDPRPQAVVIGEKALLMDEPDEHPEDPLLAMGIPYIVLLDERYLPTTDDPRTEKIWKLKVVYIRSGLGTGKSTVIADMLRRHGHLGHNEVVAVANRITLVEDLAGKWDLAPYDRTDGDLTGRIAVTVDSMTRVQIIKVGPDGEILSCRYVLVIDESESFFRHLANSKTVGYKRNAIYNALHNLVASGIQIICADAHLGHVTVRAMRRILPGNKSEGLIYNSYRHEGRTVKRLTTKVEVHAAVINAYREGAYVALMTSSKADAYASAWRMLGKKGKVPKGKGAFKAFLKAVEAAGILLLTADTIDQYKPYLGCLGDYIKDRGYKTVIATPTISSGVDLPLKNFTKVFGIFARNGGLTAKDCIQMIGRWRCATEVVCWVDPNIRHAETNEGQIARNLLDCSTRVKGVLIRGGLPHDEDLFKLVVNVKAVTAWDSNDLCARFDETMKADGYKGTVAPPTLTEVETKAARKALKSHKDEIATLRDEAIMEARVLTEVEAERINRAGPQNLDEQLEIRKDHLTSFYPSDVILDADLTKSNRHGAHMRQCRALARLTLLQTGHRDAVEAPVLARVRTGGWSAAMDSGWEPAATDLLLTLLTFWGIPDDESIIDYKGEVKAMMPAKDMIRTLQGMRGAIKNLLNMSIPSSPKRDEAIKALLEKRVKAAAKLEKAALKARNGARGTREGTGGTYTKRKASPVPSSKASPVPSDKEINQHTLASANTRLGVFIANLLRRLGLRRRHEGKATSRRYYIDEVRAAERGHMCNQYRETLLNPPQPTLAQIHATLAADPGEDISSLLDDVLEPSDGDPTPPVEAPTTTSDPQGPPTVPPPALPRPTLIAYAVTVGFQAAEMDDPQMARAVTRWARIHRPDLWSAPTAAKPEVRL